VTKPTTNSDRSETRSRPARSSEHQTRPYAPAVMFGRAAIGLLASVAIACGSAASQAELSPSDLLKKANANFQSAKTTHLDGTGSFSIKSGLSIAFDLKLSGDAEMPDKARMNVQMSILGQNLSVDTVTIGGKTYTRGLTGSDWESTDSTGDPTGAMLDPLGQADLSAVATVSEIDRPEVDGKKTRHLKYSIDAGKILEKMRSATNGSTFSASNVSAGGEVWIRTDDSQIVRQLVKVAFDVEGDLGLPTSTPSTPTGKGTFEMAFDLKFSHIGEPISPAIIAPR
jgi:hypothetical protein